MISNKLWCFILIFSITKVCHSHLTCYVCENCDKITIETPLFKCNQDFFNNGGTTDSSIQTTTIAATTTAEATTTTTTEPLNITKNITEDITTTSKTSSNTTIITTTTENTGEPMKTTTENAIEITTKNTNDEITTERSTETTLRTTESQPPTPHTVGPPMTTTALPTPPNPGTLTPIDNVEKLNNRSEAHEQHVNKDEVDDVDIDNATTKAYKPSAEFRVRQLRSVSDDVTYHCFKVHATTFNGTTVVNRGCSRVQTMESVCDQWKAQHPNEQINKCYPCSRSKCNGSSALSVSITALFVAIVGAVLIHRK